MVLMTGLDSIVESLYLKDNLTYLSKSASILVNPVSSYISKKVIVINRKNYPLSYVDELIDNKNIVISRFDIGRKDVLVHPYELRMNESIMPLGKKVEVISDDTYDKVDHIFDIEDMKLYYPKPIKCLDYQVNGSLTIIGYLSYQLGYDISDIVDAEFRHLDVIKMKNGIII